MVRLSPVLIVTVSVTLLASVCLGARPPIATTPAAKAMGTTIANVSHSDATFVDALRSYRAATGVKITVDWEALQRAGVTPTSKVSVAGTSLTFAQALDLTLTRLQGARAPLCWYVNGKNVHITTQAAVLGARRNAPTLPIPSGRPARGTTTQPARKRTSGILLDFDQTAIVDVVRFFRETTRMNVVVNWRALATVGVVRDMPVTLKINQPIPITRALDLFVGTFNAGKPPLQQVYWDYDKRILSITTGEALNQKMEMKVFDVASMLMGQPNFVGPQMSISRGSSGGGNSSGGRSDGAGRGGGSSGGLSGRGGRQGAQPQAADPTQAQREQELITIFKNTIGDEFWQPLGKGSIRIRKGRMFVNQTRLGHKLMQESIKPKR